MQCCTSGMPNTAGEFVEPDKRPVCRSIVDSASSRLDHATASTLALAPGVMDAMTALSMSAFATPDTDAVPQASAAFVRGRGMMKHMMEASRAK